MDIRKIALALPLVVGVACQTSGGSSERTASAQEPSTTSSTAQAGASGQTGEPTGAGASAQGSVDPYDTDASATARAGDTTVSGSADADTGATPGISGSAEAGTGSMSGTMSGSDMKGHASDQIVSGKVKKVSKSSIDIEATGGDKTTLRIVPETLVTVDGMDAKPAQLKEGQEVRASFNEVEGKETAVRIEAGMGTGSSGSMMHPGSSGSGSMSPGGGSGLMDPGTGGTSTTEPDTGSSGTTGDPTSAEPDTDTGSSSGSMSPGGGTGGTTR